MWRRLANVFRAANRVNEWVGDIKVDKAVQRFQRGSNLVITLDFVEIHSHSIQSIYRAELTFGNFFCQGICENLP